MLRPSWAEFTGSLPENLGDPTLIAWLAAWGGHSVMTDPTSYFDAPNFWPAENTLAYSDSLLPLSVVFSPIWALTGNWAVALNMTVFAMFMTNALAMYSLARWLSGSTAGAVFAGLGFTFSTYFMSHLANLQMLAAAGLPLGFLLLGKVLAHGRLRHAVAAGVVTTATVLAAAYYGALWALIATTMVAGWLLIRRRTVSRRTLRGLAVAAAVAGALTLPFALPYLDLQSDATFARPVLDRGGLEAGDLVTPAIDSALYAEQSVRPSARGHEFRFFPGLLFSAAAIAGTTAVRRRARAADGTSAPAGHTPLRDGMVEQQEARVLTQLIVAAGGLSFLCALGPEVLGHPGPFRLLFEVVPGFSGIRLPARFFAGALVAFAVLSAFGAARALDRLPFAARPAVILGACTIVLLEMLRANSWAPLPQDAETLAAYRALAQRPAGAAVELPMVEPFVNPEYPYLEATRQLYSSLDWHPRVNGYSGYFRPGYQEDSRLLNTFPSEAALERLATLRVRYVLIHGGSARSLSEFSQGDVDAMLPALPPGAIWSRHGADVLIDLRGTR